MLETRRMDFYDAIVVGGRGAVGSLLCEHLRRDGLTVLAVDPRPKGGVSVETDHAVGDILDPSARLRQLLAGADLVVLAVPESVALRVPPSLLAETGLVVETLSVKSGFATKVAEEGAGGPVVGINPMFAPSLGVEGRPVAAVTHRSGAAATDFLGRLSTWGAHVVEVDPDTHDRLAAATQALTHAAVLAFGGALDRLGVDPALVEALAPPPARTALAMLARISSGEPEVYWDVQAANPHAAAARSALAGAANEMDAAVTAGSEAEFGAFVRTAGGQVPNVSAYSDLCARLFGIVRGSASEGDRP